jgi:hypothetical protein
MPMPNWSGRGKAQWLYQLNYEAPGPIVLDREVYRIPKIQINLPSMPNSYEVFDFHIIKLIYRNSQYVVVSYNYRDSKEDSSEIAYLVKVKLRDDRVHKVDTIGKFKIYYLNIDARDMKYIENVTVKVND